MAGIPTPHPAIANLILRRNLPEKERISLSYLHELGHIQTLPLALILIAIMSPVLKRNRWKLRALLPSWIAHQALWEAMAELYVIHKSGQEYRRVYSENPNGLGLSLFWLGVSALFIIFFRRTKPLSRKHLYRTLNP